MKQDGERPEVTRWLAERAVGARYGDLPDDAITVARQCTLDWFAVAISGAREPALTILCDELLEDGAAPVVSLVGRTERTSLVNAAMINGTASHSLDFDDVNMAILGHPSVAILPGLLALAESQGSSAREVITAFVVGYDVACRVGTLMGPSHYNHGFHATATIGSVGAAAACAHLLDLDVVTTATAYGIAATMASGLKSMFGTMCKPMHAGRAAQNGVLAARLAARGFTSREDSIECEQGLAATQSTDFNFDEATHPAPFDFHIRQNLFKFHASCYLTHGPIEASRSLRKCQDISSDTIRSININVAPITDRVCNIVKPETGLEAKFSLRLTVAMALAGYDTSGIDTFDDALTQIPELVRLRDMATVNFNESYSEANAEIVVETKQGEQFRMAHDAGAVEADLKMQGKKLDAKFNALVIPVLGETGAAELFGALRNLGEEHDIKEIMNYSRSTK
jgi:2-methylcitrate dehydratase PrpD